MEIADIFVVNKGDRPGADRLRNDIELMLGLRRGSTSAKMPGHHGVSLKSFNPIRIAREAAKADDADQWTPPVLGTVAAKGEGIDLLLEAVDRHFHYLETSGGLKGRRRSRLRNQVTEVVSERVRARLWEDPDTIKWLDSQLDLLESGAATPFSVADELLRRSGPLLTGVDA
jgi:LAO/AO transport system kinase